MNRQNPKNFILNEKKSKKQQLNGALQTMICAVFFALAGINICKDVFPNWIPGPAQWGKTVVFAVIIILYFEIIQPQFLKPACWRMITALLFVSAGGHYVWKQQKKMNGQLQNLVEEYLIRFNKCMKTNYHMTGTKAGKEAQMFLLLATFFFLLVLVFTYVCRKKVLLLLFPATMLLLSMMIDQVPHLKSFALLFVGILLLNSGEWERTQLLFSKNKSTDSLHHIFQTAFVAGIALFLLAGSYLFFRYPASLLLKKNRTVKEFQVTLEQTLLSLPLSFSKDITIDNHTPQYRDRKIMTLQMNRQPDNNVYLRGKIGTVYAQGAWKGKNDHFSSEYEESGFPKADIGFWYQTGYMSQKDAVNKKVSYTIDYDITTDISYRPYFTDALQVSDSEYLFQDEGFRKKRANKTTAFIGCPVPDFSKDAAIASNTNIQTTYEDSDNDLLKWYETYVQDVYAVPQKEMPSVTAFAEQIQTKELPETFMIEGNRRTMENMYRIKTAEQVRLELAKQCSYRLQLDSIKDGTDTVEYFLSKSHKGYCTHFASAGVFLLRQLQIPARYVSGYVISKESFKVQADGNFKAQVIDRNAHAWVEIYLNEIGWVPVDMTPGYAQNPSILPTQMSKEQLAELEKESNASYPDKETSKETAQEKKEETVTHKKTNAETETQKQKNQKESRLTNQTGTAQKQKKTIPGKVLGFWLVFLIAASGIILVRRYIFWYQNILNDEYKTKSYSKMIQRINRRIYHAFLWKKKQLHSSLTDEEYALALSEVFTELTVDEWKQYVQILQKTCFSQDLLLSDDAAFCYRLYHRVMERK